MPAFDGFPKETLTFLRGLERNNKKEWFEAHRSDYEDHFLEPAKAFVVALGERLEKDYPHIVVSPRVNGTIRRLNRDVRFSKDKSPYKTHLDFFMPVAQSAEGCGPRVFLRIEAKQVTVGGGVYEFTKGELQRYRDAVAEPATAKEVDKLLRALEKKGYEVGGKHYKRLPRGYEASGLSAEYLRYDKLFCIWQGPPPAELHSKAFVNFCAKHFKAFRPLLRWLESI